MLLKEADEMLTGNSSVLRTGNSVSTKSARVEPLTHSTWRHFTDLSDLTSSEDRPHCGVSNHNLSRSERRLPPWIFTPSSTQGRLS